MHQDFLFETADDMYTVIECSVAAIKCFTDETPEFTLEIQVHIRSMPDSC